MAEGDAWRSPTGDPRLARSGRPEMTSHGLDPDSLASGEWPSPAASQPLAASEGAAGVPGRAGGSDGAPGGAERVVGYRALEPGEQARHTEALAGALRETWMAGKQLNMERPVGDRIDWLQWAHAIEQRLAGLNDREPGPAEPFAPVTAPVDTVERGARAMFAETSRFDAWDAPSIPEDLREHYRRLARAVLEAR